MPGDEYDDSRRMPTVRVASDQRVSLGCGTLILIALIVLFFGGHSTDELEKEVRSLRDQVKELRSDVQAQTIEVRQLRTELEKARNEKKP